MSSLTYFSKSYNTKYEERVFSARLGYVIIMPNHKPINRFLFHLTCVVISIEVKNKLCKRRQCFFNLNKTFSTNEIPLIKHKTQDSSEYLPN